MSDQIFPWGMQPSLMQTSEGINASIDERHVTSQHDKNVSWHNECGIVVIRMRYIKHDTDYYGRVRVRV